MREAITMEKRGTPFDRGEKETRARWPVWRCRIRLLAYESGASSPPLRWRACGVRCETMKKCCLLQVDENGTRGFASVSWSVKLFTGNLIVVVTRESKIQIFIKYSFISGGRGLNTNQNFKTAIFLFSSTSWTILE